MKTKPYSKTMSAAEVGRTFGRYEITRLHDGKVEFRSKLPRRGSKWWNKACYCIFDNLLNAPVPQITAATKAQVASEWSKGKSQAEIEEKLGVKLHLKGNLGSHHADMMLGNFDIKKTK